jgi:MoxR-like ATPase
MRERLPGSKPTCHVLPAWPPFAVAYHPPMFESIDDAEQQLSRAGYFATREVATALFLGLRLGKPVLVEGAHGAGKSALAEATARALGCTLLRVQCHEHLSPAQVAFEWDMAKQVLHARLALERGESTDRVFSDEYLLKLPFLAAITGEGPMPPVLLVDEVDRAPFEFQAFLQEFFGDYTLTIPHVGPVRALVPPLVVVTSNGEGVGHDSLRGHCLYLWLDHPSFAVEREIILQRVASVDPALAGQVCNVMDVLRHAGFAHPPGVAETLDWVRALVALRKEALDRETIDQTLGCVLKSADDMERFRRERFWDALEPRLDAAV